MHIERVEGLDEGSCMYVYGERGEGCVCFGVRKMSRGGVREMCIWGEGGRRILREWKERMCLEWKG